MTPVITARIFETPEIFQDCFIYLDEVEPRIITAEIKIPLMLKPSDLWTDVRVALDEAGLNYVRLMDKIEHTFFPKDVSI